VSDARDDTDEATDRRTRGRQVMQEVYGWELGEHIEGDFVELTVDHLFGTIWARPGLTIRERRLLLVGLLVGDGLDDVVGLQLDAALRQGDLRPDELRELVVFLAHYAGWPRAAKLNTKVEELLAAQERARQRDAEGSGEGS
jgi:4-carboxymuconolactone decarboxylase